MHIMTSRGWKPIRPSFVVPPAHTPTLLEQMGVRNPAPMNLEVFDTLVHLRNLGPDNVHHILGRGISDAEFWRLVKAL